jgi:hypothetical protein
MAHYGLAPVRQQAADEREENNFLVPMHLKD